jgi:epoxyqueuosine reductase QueG
MATERGRLDRGIETIARRHEIGVVGFADLSLYQDHLVAFGGDIVKGYPRAVSIAIPLPGSIVDGLRDRRDPNNASLYYFHGYEIVNSRLDIASSTISSFLHRSGYKALPIPAAARTNIENAAPTVSHKMVAHIAGLGWIGKNCLLVTPKYGPRIRLTSILTDAPVTGVDKPLVQRCNDCTACVGACPASAIKGKNYKPGEPREKRFDFRKCQGYFDELKQDSTRKPVCGMCLYICPHGIDGTVAGALSGVGKGI